MKKFSCFTIVIAIAVCTTFMMPAEADAFTGFRKHKPASYLAFEAVDAGATVSLEIVGEVDAPSLEFRTGRQGWTAFDFSNPQKIVLKKAGDKVFWRNTGKTDHFSKDRNNYIHFVLEKHVAAKGSVMSLLDKSCKSLTIPSEYCFVSLFYECTGLTKAPELPAIELADMCYFKMFLGCSSLVKAPENAETGADKTDIIGGWK